MHRDIFNSVFQFKKLDEEVDGYFPEKSCDTCLNRDIRLSTGCSWCGFKHEPVGFSICWLYEKDWKTNRIMWDLAYCHWDDYLLDKMKRILEDKLNGFYTKKIKVRGDGK